MNWVQHFLSAAWSTARPSQTQQHWKCWMVQMTAWCHCTWKPSHLPQHLENTCTHCPFTRGWVIPCYSLLALHHVDVLMFVFIPIQHKVLKYQYRSWVTSYKSWSCLRKCFSFLVGSTCVNKWGGGGGRKMIKQLLVEQHRLFRWQSLPYPSLFQPHSVHYPCTSEKMCCHRVISPTATICTKGPSGKGHYVNKTQLTFIAA